MPSIGGKSFLTWRGPKVCTAAMVVSEITRPGIDGHAFAEVAIRGAPVSVTTSADTSNPDTLGNQYLDMQGTFVTVVNVDASSVSNVMVVSVRILNTRAMLNPVGGLEAGTWLLTAQWELQPPA